MKQILTKLSSKKEVLNYQVQQSFHNALKWWQKPNYQSIYGCLMQGNVQQNNLGFNQGILTKFHWTAQILHFSGQTNTNDEGIQKVVHL